MGANLKYLIKHDLFVSQWSLIIGIIYYYCNVDSNRFVMEDRTNACNFSTI